MQEKRGKREGKKERQQVQERKDTKSGSIKSLHSKAIRPLVGLAIISLLICGLFYPLLVTGISQVILPYQANGEPVQLNGRVVGSNLIDNGFSLPIFFHARPQNASASGVDPDITIPDAISQIPRISNATGIPPSALAQIVSENEEGTYWIFGSPYVNVLRLNLDLIRTYPSVYSNFTTSKH